MPDRIGFEPSQDVTGADASKLNGVPVPPLGGPGAVLTVNAAGTGLEYDVPAAGVMLASTTPAAVGTSGAVGTGTTAARSDHVHALPNAGTAGTYANPSSMTTDAQGRVTSVTAGSAPVALASTTPAALGTAAVGTGTTAARSDHVHEHGNQAGGSLHSDVVAAGASGFMSGSDKSKLDGIASGATNLALSSTTPEAVGTAAVGTGTTAARSDHVHALPSTAVSAGSYPTAGQIPTFTVDAEGRLTAAGSSTTITSPAISNPTFSGTEGGTRTIGGSPTLGVNLAAGGFKVTGLGAPTAASSDAATAAYAEAQKTGGAGPPFYLNTGQSFVANGYVGIGGDGSSTLVQNVVPWRVPAPGVIRDMSVFGFANAPSTLHVLIYKATNPTTTPTYSATALDTTVSSGTNTGSDTTHSVSVNAGDLVVGFCDTSWSANGAQISFRYIPN